ncbi:hypothetical protein IHE45_13G027200 [Dioscorea alata]|uniref:Uncharacterized protein n=1 Tax=Dioscorea alata TaxID=55571 RepID=A0ACB7UWY5_DIOAL|nr:hypothetical protein IHE45_13G027200 [Dioscorea alata]
MSRRERERDGRDSHSKRFHSRSEREHRSDRDSRPDRGPSPKKVRRDGKPATERIHASDSNLDTVGLTDPDLKQHRRLKDPLPLEDLATEKKAEPEIMKKHDERGSAGHGGRSFIHKATDHGRWSERKEQPVERARDRTDTKDTQRKDEKAPSRGDDKSVWRHDGFYELETDAPPARKRPAFREQKMPVETEPAAAEMSKQPALDTGIKEEKGHYSHGLDKPGRPYPRVDERYAKRGDGSYYREQRPGYQSRRDRYAGGGGGGGGGGGMRGRDRFNGRYAERRMQYPGDAQPEKWKHDLFDEANKSPAQKNEEEQIAKVEALLLL